MNPTLHAIKNQWTVPQRVRESAHVGDFDEEKPRLGTAYLKTKSCTHLGLARSIIYVERREKWIFADSSTRSSRSGEWKNEINVSFALCFVAGCFRETGAGPRRRQIRATGELLFLMEHSILPLNFVVPLPR